MTKDDILQALRLTAMGRANHPLQEELAEKLAALFVKPAYVYEAMKTPELDAKLDAALSAHLASAKQSPLETPAAAFKRGPGRPKKAE